MRFPDVIGKALLDYYDKPTNDLVIKVISPDFDDDVIPVKHFFREFSNMPDLEQRALDFCKGKVLDVGAGAGSHALYLQQNGLEVTALDASPGAADVMQKRDVKKVLCDDIINLSNLQYDSVLLLMNGIGIAGTPAGARKLFLHLKKLLTHEGQIILDSSDLIYLYEDDTPQREFTDSFYGIIEYQMEYKGMVGKPFKWLYLDINSLQRIATDCGFEVHVVQQDDHFGYLAQLIKK